MDSSCSYYRKEGAESELKQIISQVINNKNISSKLHSDCLNCFINCAEYKFILQIIQEPKNGRNNLFFIQEGENFYSPLFFYEISSNEIIEIIENKNITENYLSNKQKIKSENEIISKFEQNKKNKILLFNYIKFPLVNINSESNDNNKSTIIILDDGKYETITNYSINSYSTYNNNYSLLFEIHNLKSAKYLFSIDDIKDCKQIKFKFNGNVHGQKLFKEDAVCTIPPQLIINSIKNRMKNYINIEDKEIRKNLYTKLFFTQLKDENRNNIGILFSFGKIKDIDETKFDEEYIMQENYKIIKLFICIDLWINGNNIHETKDTSESSSIISNPRQKKNKDNYYNSNFNNDLVIKSQNNNKYDYSHFYNCDNENNNNCIEQCNSNKNYYIHNYKFKNNDDETNIYNNQINDNSEYNIISNNLNETYYYNNYRNYNNSIDFNQKKEENNYNPIKNKFSKKFYRNNYYNSYEGKQTKENYFREYTNYNYIRNEILPANYENEGFLENLKLEEDYYELNHLLNNLKYLNNNENNIYYDYFKESTSENKNDGISTKSIFLDTKKEFIKELFSKYKQNNCISNYDIIEKNIDINMNIEKEKLKNVKLNYFFDYFQNNNQFSLNIPFLNKKGKLSFNEIDPTLSSMRLIFKTKKKVAKNIIKKKRKNYNIKLVKPNLLKIEYDEIKPPHERDLLFIKLEEIKHILGQNKLTFKHVLTDKSYFSILWSFTNTFNFHSSFLAYYSFDLKLIGFFIIKMDSEQWLSSFSNDMNYYQDYKKEYNKNIENLKTFFKNLSIDKEDGYYQNFVSHDYMNYIKNINNT